MAGFFDGEGSLGIYRSGNTLGLQVQISNCVPGTLELFAERFGGRVRERPANHHQAKNPKWRPAYYWSVYADNAEKCLRVLSPFLRDKADQSRLALKWRSLSREEQLVSDIPQQLKGLKRK